MAVKVQAMVLVGDNSFDPVAATAPIPLSIVMLAASLMSHCKVVDWPGLISDGLALKRVIAGGSGRIGIMAQADKRAKLQSEEKYQMGLIFALATRKLQFV